ncbi:putative uncharacterized protein BRD3OS isoform X1 [Sturnira hondurensis]|uniref:putative uncharacterized protein BRD3OS isoform X1 n=1 Tax=Sturnira hondurensis TaxID=192404 RepID=UPI0018799FBF|nr:putative uncharacterized protein BRD3OS isoform X1 [Sturnira hondurensis]
METRPWGQLALLESAAQRSAAPCGSGVSENHAARVTAARAGGRKGLPDAWGTKKAVVAGITLGKSCPLAPQCKARSQRCLRTPDKSQIPRAAQ